MGRIIIIDNAHDCPNRIDSAAGEQCNLDPHYRFCNSADFPEWCPLDKEDKEDEEDEEDEEE